MIRISDNIKVKWFEYIYMFVMVIYMAQMTTDTGRMVGLLSGNPIPLLIPIVLTIILLIRNKISFKSKNLLLIMVVFVIWSILILFKYESFAVSSEYSYMFFLFYAIIIAYIHVRVYGNSIFALYENIMVLLCKIALPLWVINAILYYSDPGLMSFLEDTHLGYNILYLYNWMDHAKEVQEMVILRNSGCSWEPGRFSIMITLAMYVNMSRVGVKFAHNSNIWYLLLALLTTQSTTGYVVAIFLYVVFLIRRCSICNTLLALMVLFPTIMMMFQLDFMGAKIQDQLKFEENMTDYENQFEYSTQIAEEGEYKGSLDRLPAVYFETRNVQHDPLLGYSRNPEHSYFYQEISSNFVLTGGLMKVLGQYGIPLGILIYGILLYSSFQIAGEFKNSRKWALFIAILLSSVSYVIWCIPVFTAFWMYGLFAKPITKEFKE